MATRFYIDAGAVPTISPTADASVWEQTTAMVRRLMTTRSANDGSAEATIADVETSAANNFDVVLLQTISPPLAAQTISGAISGQMRASETNALAQDFPHILVRAFDATGTTSRGTLLDFVGATEHTLTTLTNAKYPASTTPTSTAVQNGDVLVVEWGWRSIDTNVTSWGSTLSYGRGAATDLPVDEATTTALNPWIEFADNLLFMPDEHSYNWKSGPGMGGYFTELIQSTQGSASTALTFTIPAVRGKRHAITSLRIMRSTNGAIGAGAPLYISTMNMGGLGWCVGNVQAAGNTQTDVYMQWRKNPFLVDFASTPTIIQLPAPGTAGIWSVNVTYTLVP